MCLCVCERESIYTHICVCKRVKEKDRGSYHASLHISSIFLVATQPNTSRALVVSAYTVAISPVLLGAILYGTGLPEAFSIEFTIYMHGRKV